MRRLLLVGLLCGLCFAGGWAARESPREGRAPVSHSGPIVLYNVAPLGSGEPVELQPFRVVVDGRGTDVGTPPLGSGEVWRIDLDGGRVKIFAATR